MSNRSTSLEASRPVQRVIKLLAKSHPLGVGQQPLTSRRCNCQVSLRGGESPSTPLPINLWPWVVKMLMVMGGRELKAKMITPSLPVTPGERVRCPPLG